MGSSEREHEIALMEGHLIAAADEYFKARHEMLDTLNRRRVYEAAYKRAWDDARRAQASAEPCAWEVRRLDPVEGPSIWLHAHRVDIEGYRRRPELYELRPLYAAPQQARLPESLHTFLDAAAGDGVVIGGVDAADLYIELFPERYAAATAKLDAGATDGISAGKEKTNG